MVTYSLSSAQRERKVDKPEQVEIELSELRDLVLANLNALGLDAHEAGVVASVLLYAELRDKSQGLIKIIEKTVVPSPDRDAIDVEKKTPVVYSLQANGNAGMVVLNKATSLSIDVCREQGIAVIGTVGTASSSGSIGYYVERIAHAGFIGVLMAGSPKVMTVRGSLCRSMGTNPLAIAVPTGESPLVLDMATAATSWFEIVEHAKLGASLKTDVALDKSGRPTRDAAEALQGFLLTFGGHKGSGLALMIELLTGPLLGASIVGDTLDCRGNLLIAINPGVFVTDFTARVDQLLTTIKNAPTQPSFDAVRLPGEYGRELALERERLGYIKLDYSTLSFLRNNAVEKSAGGTTNGSG